MRCWLGLYRPTVEVSKGRLSHLELTQASTAIKMKSLSEDRLKRGSLFKAARTSTKATTIRKPTANLRRVHTVYAQMLVSAVVTFEKQIRISKIKKSKLDIGGWTDYPGSNSFPTILTMWTCLGASAVLCMQWTVTAPGNHALLGTAVPGGCCK